MNRLEDKVLRDKSLGGFWTIVWGMALAGLAF